ncbi:MAG: response regulator [Candidatus Omnitrophota bacterium]
MEKTKVLLVDDEIDLILIMGKRIKGWGYDLLEALNGKEALLAVESKHPDIVILDYMMPDMDGITTLKEIRKVNKNIPVIMFTAFPDKKSIEDTESLGVSAYIPKLSMFPASESSLKTALKMAEKGLKKGDVSL